MPRVLLVEDNDALSRFLCEVLVEGGYADCDCAATKAEAATALLAVPYDVVIADVGLPDGSGRDVALLASAVGTKTVLISGYPEEISALTANGVAYLKKPFTVRDFIEIIKRHCIP